MGTLSLQIAQFEYFKRHLSSFAPYVTPRKVANLVRNAMELRRVVVAPKSMPPYIKIEPTPLCQLRCTGCAQRDASFRAQFDSTMQLSLDTTKAIIEPMSDTLLGVSLSLTGEPMLNKNIIPIIEYIHSKNICVTYPSNLSVPMDRDKAERLVASGLDTLYVSLDGASAETYTRYRVLGRFDLILKNVRLLADAKRKLGRKRPRLVWKFVVFDYNRHEVEIVKRDYRRLGFDAYEFVLDSGSTDRHEQNERHKQRAVEAKTACFWLWHTMIIRWNGIVDPCCNACAFVDGRFNLGNAVDTDVRDIFHSRAYADLRRGFVTHAYGRDMHPLCAKCMRCSTDGEYVRGGDSSSYGRIPENLVTLSKRKRPATQARGQDA